MLDSLRIPYTGTYRNEEKRRQRYPLLIHKTVFELPFLTIPMIPMELSHPLPT